jgi:hypothetical protein
MVTTPSSPSLRLDMAWRFRKSVKVFPGVRINIGKKGISTTIGVRGASVNISNRGTFLNTGVPGTGLSNRSRIDTPDRPASIPRGNRSASVPSSVPSLIPDFGGQNVLDDAGSIKSVEAEAITSDGLQSLKLMLLDAHQEKSEIEKLLAPKGKVLSILDTRLQQKEKSWITRRFFPKKIEAMRESVEEARAEVEELQQQRDLCLLDVDVECEPEIDAAYQHLSESFDTLSTCQKIWDITSAVATSAAERSAASQSVDRREVQFDRTSLELVKSSRPAMRLRNANGGDLYVYPGFVLILSGEKELGLVDLAEVTVEYRPQRFLEEDGVPSDSKVVDHTWKKVNKDGSPDKRFAGNYQIPVAYYGKVRLSSATGLNEEYSFSNAQSASDFAEAFTQYRDLLNSGTSSPERSATRAASIRPIATLPDESPSLDLNDDGEGEEGMPDTGDVIEGKQKESWIINAKTNLPITLIGIERTVAEQIKSVLDESYNETSYYTAKRLTPIIARSNVRWKELDEYLAKYGERYRKSVEQMISSSTEWSSASDRDRSDLRAEFKLAAMNQLEVRPIGVDVSVLFDGDPEDATLDDALIDRYGFDLLQVYLRCADGLEKVRVVPADHYSRQDFERMVEVGLAARGQEIAPADILASLKLQEMNALVVDRVEKPLRKKADAIAFLAAQGDIMTLLAGAVAFRELFQLRVLPDEFSQIDLAAVSRSWKHAAAVAEVMANTYSSAGRSIQFEQKNRDLSFIKGWTVWHCQCSHCQALPEKVYPKKQFPKVPYHVGCMCFVRAEF